MDFDTAVKMNIYETIARTTQAPTAANVSILLCQRHNGGMDILYT
jgi:hypothetical protein